MRTTKLTAAFGIAALILAAGCSTKHETILTSVPPGAQMTIDQYAEGGKVLQLKAKVKSGRHLYEAEVKTADGTRIEILADKDGKLYKMEREECKIE